MFAEATVLFLMNGLTIILVLQDQVSGVVQMVVGIVFSMSALIWLLTNESRLNYLRIVIAFSTLMAFVVGQLSFLLIYGLSTITATWIAFALFVAFAGSCSYRTFTEKKTLIGAIVMLLTVTGIGLYLLLLLLGKF